MKKYSLALALFLPLAAVACGDDSDGDGTCAVDSDCTELNPICDFRTSQCVTGCDEPSDCGGNLPTCNSDSSNILAPSVCICQAGSCPDGQLCLPDGSCGLPGSNGGVGCGTVGEQGTCSAGEICVDDAGTCETLCDNGNATQGCLSMEMLCDTSTMSATFNTCVMPQAVTGGCSNVASHSRDSDGPVIISVSQDTSMTMTSPNCTGNASVQRYEALVFAPDMIDGSLFTNGVRRLTAMGNEGATFSDGPAEPSHPSVTAVMMRPDEFLVGFSLCLSADEMMQQLAVFVRDVDNEQSNGACFNAQ